MPIQGSGEVRLRGTAGDGRTDINEEINSNATDTDVSLGTLNTTAFTAVSDGSVITGRAMSEMRGYSSFPSPFPSTQAAGALGESLYFGGSNEYIRRTTTLAGNSKTFTLSFWIKIEKVNSDLKTLFSHGNGGTDRFYCFFENNKFYINEFNGSSYTLQLEIDQIIDVTGWYHIVIANDTTKSYTADRTKVYINGIEMSLTSTTSYDLNDESYINSNSSTFAIGYDYGITSRFFPGTIADFKSIDGQQLRPDSFGKLHEGIWIPQAFNTPSTDTLVTSNLVANYELNGNANDTSVGGTTYNGTPSNVTFLNNNYGIASFAGGSASRISLGAGNQFASSTLTFSFWYMPTAAPSGTTYKILFSNYTNSFSNGFFNLSRNTDHSLEIGLYAGSGYFYRKTKPNAVVLNTWTHLVITMDNTKPVIAEKVNFYINGFAFEHFDNSSSGTPSGNFLNFSNSLLVGDWDHQGGYTDTSNFGELQIYTSALTPSQITQNYNATKHQYAYGLNGFWLPLNNTSIGSIDSSSNLKLHLDASNNSSYGGSGTTWTDLTSNSNNGTISGANFLSTTNGGVFNFDGSNDKVEITTIKDDVDNGQDVSMEVWFNCSSSQSGEGIICGFAGSSGEAGMDIGIKPSTGLIYMSQGSGSTGVAGYDVRDNKWHHAVMTMTSSVKNLYLDGVLIDSSSATNRGTFPNDFHIGTWAGSYNGYYFNGKIAQVRIYDKVLLANEIITNYRATQGNYEQVSTVDISNNANTFTATNIDAIDHIKDEPLDNYPVMHHYPYVFGFSSITNPVHTNGGRQLRGNEGGFISDFSANTGKWYWEVEVKAANSYFPYTGVTSKYNSSYNSGGETSVIRATEASKYGSNTNVGYSSPDVAFNTSGSYGVTTGTIISFKLDLDAGNLYVLANNVLKVTDAGIPSDGSKFFHALVGFSNDGTNGTGWSEVYINFGQKEFSYTIPSGYKTFGTKNLPDPSINPNSATAENPSDYFKAVTYQGNGGTQGDAYGYKEGSKAAVFNGSSSFISLPASVNLNNNFSWSFWIKFKTQTQYDTPFGFFMNSCTNFIDSVNVGQLSFYDGNSRLNTPSNTFVLGNWYHVVVTKSSTAGRKFYVNGVEVASNSSNSNSGSTTGGRNLLGAYSSGGNPTSEAFKFDGKLDEVRIFNKALSAAEVGYLYNDNTSSINNISNLIAYYDMEGDSNDNALQAITSTATYQLNSDGTSIPSNTYPLTTNGITFASGKFGNAAGLSSGNSSSGDYMKVSNSIYGSSTTVFSWSLWIKCNNSTGTGVNIMGNGALAGGQTGYTVYLYNGRLALSTLQSSDQYFPNPESNGTLINDNQWHHIVLAYNNGPFVLYLDGSAYQTGTSSNYTNNATPASDTYIGNTFQRGISDGIVNGQIDQVRVFGGTILDQNAVTVLYNETTTTAQSASIQSTLYDGTESNITYTQDKPYGNINVGFAPDLVWVKNRSNSTAYFHGLIDSVRGARKVLSSNTNTVDSTTYTDQLTSFDSDGFSLGNNASGGNYVNLNADNYVAWNWKAGGAPTKTNTGSPGAAPTLGSVMIDGVASTASLAGSLAAKKISANTKSGFSIVKYTAGSATNQSIAHGLSSAPKLVLIKKTSGTEGWIVWYEGAGTDNWLELNSSNAKDTSAGWGGVPTSTVVHLQNSGAGRSSANGVSYIAYCFADVADYQKIGLSYDGNGSSNGPLFHTGFKPAFLLVKGVSHGGSWAMLDNKRSTTNPADEVIYADSSGAEGANDVYVKANFLSNGFQLKTNDSGINMSGRTYIYLAIAEDSQKHSNAVATLGDGNEFIQDANYPEDNFSTTTYTGNGGTQKITTGVDADFVWIKGRSYSDFHAIYDTIRGIRNIGSNSTNQEGTNTTMLTSFDSNGFSVGTDAPQFVNKNNETYVAWSWKAAGHEYKSARFNGSSSKIDIASTITGNNSFSVSFWLNPTANNITPFMMGNAATGQAFLTFVTGNTLNFGRGGDSQGYTTSNTIPNDTWTHIAVSSNAGSVTVYVNGVSNLTFSTTYNIGSGGTFIGYASGYGQYYEGRIDQVRIFNRAISPANVTTLYNETKATVDTLQVLGDTSCIATYRLNGDARDLSGNYHGTESNIDYQKGSHFAYNIYENKARTFSHKGSDLSLNTGTITPDSINANRDNGFSIIKYTGLANGNNKSFSHGLSKPPEIIIIKDIDWSTPDWFIWNKDLSSNTHYLRFTTAGEAQSSTVYSAAPTNSLINIGNDSGVGNRADQYICYAWHSVPGYSKMGSYTGNGSTTGTIVTLDFEPSLIIVKGLVGDRWLMADNKRHAHLNNNAFLDAQDTHQESALGTGNGITFLSNGFQLATNDNALNGTNRKYIYMAFAHR